MTKSQLKQKSGRTRTRAVAAADKEQRRAAIVAAAHALIHHNPSATFSVEELARRVGLAKGTLYLYFGSREEVLLALHLKQSHEIFDVLEQALAVPAVDVRSVLAASMVYFRAHPEFFPLAGNCRGMLDTNVTAEAALAFKVAIGKRLVPLGERIEALYAGLAPGEGAALVMNSYAFIIGLWQQADTPVVLRDAMKRPEMAIFRIDFEKQLTTALLDLWESAARRGAERKS